MARTTRVTIAKARPAAAAARPAAVAATRALVVALLAACTEPTGELEVPKPDPVVFRDAVYPILLRDCGFPGCHGTSERFFAVYGPGRTRLDPQTDIFAPATATELALTYERASSMLVGPDGPRGSLLVRKPIPPSQGGAGHRGDDLWGTAVFRSKDDQRYATLYNWATKGAP